MNCIRRFTATLRLFGVDGRIIAHHLCAVNSQAVGMVVLHPNLWYTGDSVWSVYRVCIQEGDMSEEFSFRDWASQGLEGVRGMVHLPKGRIVPQGFRSHMKASRKEFLLAFRSLFDEAIERMDSPKGPRRKGTTIKPE
jgi:hypothetical protein